MKKIVIAFLIFSISVHKNLGQTNDKDINWSYPYIKTDTISEYCYGHRITDYHRNLENFNDTSVKIWAKKQNELFDTVIHNINYHDSLYHKIEKMKMLRKRWSNFPRVVGNRYFYAFGYFKDNDIERLAYTDTINKQSVELYNTQEINNKNNAIYTFNYYEPSLDGKYIAFGISPDGNEKASILIIDVEKKVLLPEKIDYSHAGDIQWLPDGSGFFYIKDKEIKTEEDKNTYYEDAVVCLHKLYTDPLNDKPVLSRLLSKNIDLEKINWPRFYVNPSSDKVLINFAKGSYYVIYYTYLKDLLEKPAKDIEWKQICGRKDKMGSNVLLGNRFFGLSFGKNPNGQLITTMLPDTTPKVIVDARDFVLDDFVLNSSGLYISTINNGLNKLIKVNPKNFKTENIKLPFVGGLDLRPGFNIVTHYIASDNFVFSLTNYNKQWDIYKCDKNNHIIKTNIIPEIRYLNPPIDLEVIETEIPSHDGVLVPLSIIYKKGIKLNGTNPTLIEAYGAYGVIEKPDFKRNRLIWFNNGGIYAVAHVRGGGEKGDDWYKGGFKSTKSNSWKDLIACAEYMIKNKYTSSQNIAASGASAGGITVGRAITERPELFKAAIIYVGNLNTLRNEQTFNPGIDEFGSVKDSLGFKYLLEMDTYHHIKEGIKYPSVLFTAGINDSRVAPWIPAKTVARMQQVCKSNNIILFRVANNGHFDYPSDTDIYSFLFWQLGHPDFKLNLNQN